MKKNIITAVAVSSLIAANIISASALSAPLIVNAKSANAGQGLNFNYVSWTDATGVSTYNVSRMKVGANGTTTQYTHNVNTPYMVDDRLSSGTYIYKITATSGYNTYTGYSNYMIVQ